MSDKTTTFDYPVKALRSTKDESNGIEAIAWAMQCDRHLPHMRGCMWRDNISCECRVVYQGRRQ